jgi:phosphatidylserine decarboxylase
MSLLFSESPLIAGGAAVALLAGVYLKSNLVIGFSILMIVFLLYFYRYSPYTGGAVDDNVIISPCEGTVLDIVDRYDYYYIPIFLSPFNRHTQIYPANCLVLQRKHDLTGQFSIVMNLDKSKNNEKKIHYLMMNNGSVIELTQIAGTISLINAII